MKTRAMHALLFAAIAPVMLVLTHAPAGAGQTIVAGLSDNPYHQLVQFSPLNNLDIVLKTSLDDAATSAASGSALWLLAPAKSNGGDALDIPLWLDCQVWVGSGPVQNVSPPVGKEPAGQLHVLIVTNGVGDMAASGAVRVWFQGADATHYIRTSLVAGQNAGGSYEFVNADPVNTSFENGGTPSLNDHLEDGIAQIYVYYNGSHLDPPADANARARTTFPIDTIPPIVEPADGAAFTAADFFALTNAGAYACPYAAAGVTFGSGPFPYSTPHIQGGEIQQRDSAGVLSLLSHAPYSPGPGASMYPCIAYYNTGSCANGYPSVPMFLHIQPKIKDQTVFDKFPYLSARSDYGTRPPSGFADFSLANIGIGPAAQMLNPGLTGDNRLLPVYWAVGGSPNSAYAAFATTPLGTTSSGGVEVQADWYFSDQYGAETGLATSAGNDGFNLQGTFFARDKAGNITEYSTASPERSAGFYWFGQNTGVTLSASPNGQYYDITWTGPHRPEIDNTTPPSTFYAFNFFMSVNSGPENPLGPYQDISGGSWTWTAANQIPASQFEALENAGQIATGHWILVVVGAMDVAGNVSPWPSSFTGSPGNGTLNVPSESGPGWCAVYVGDDGDLPHTEFTASVTSGTAPLTVAFTDLSTPGSEPIAYWLWDFGDGSTSDEENPTHAYTHVGNFSVSLTVTTAVASDTKTKGNYISTHAPLPAVGFVGICMMLGGVIFIGTCLTRRRSGISRFSVRLRRGDARHAQPVCRENVRAAVPKTGQRAPDLLLF